MEADAGDDMYSTFDEIRILIDRKRESRKRKGKNKMNLKNLNYTGIVLIFENAFCPRKSPFLSKKKETAMINGNKNGKNQPLLA